VSKTPNTHSSGRFGVLLAIPVVVLAMLVPTAASAQPLDPGFCGVRVSGPNSAGVTFTYSMKNKCSSSTNFKIYLPTSGRYATGSSSHTTCQANPGFNTLTSYYSATPDPNWTIQVC
jgi:hypothetical protein